MRSEAVSTLRSWAKDRLGEQEDLLRAVERGVGRLAELDAERHETLQSLAGSLSRLGELGLDDALVAEFVGADVSRLRPSRVRSNPVAPTSAGSGSGRRNASASSMAVES